MCKSNDLKLFLDLGSHPPSDGFLTIEDLDKPEIFYPLKVYICKKCCLIQLSYVVHAEILYNKNYPYESSITYTGKKHFFEMSKNICKRFNLKKGSLVVDIGSNVGVLLSGFKHFGMSVLGVDPVSTIAKIANENGIDTIPNVFNYEVAKKIKKEKGKASIITGTNVFAHIDNLEELVYSIKHLLNEDGIFVFEAPYFVDLIKFLEYDTIYHEHLSYISVKPLIPFFLKYGMEIFDIEKVNIHGGSIRVFVGRKGKNKVSKNIEDFLNLEEKCNIYSIKHLNQFANDVKEHKNKLLKLLFDLKQNGKKIVGISAPAKGNTLLNYCKIDKDILDYITEKSKIKIGLYSPGMHIPIVSDEKLIDEVPDYALILAWNFAEEIINNLKEYKKKGGKFIIPIPTPHIIG